jgi:hypothetical protein
MTAMEFRSTGLILVDVLQLTFRTSQVVIRRIFSDGIWALHRP